MTKVLDSVKEVDVEIKRSSCCGKELWWQGKKPHCTLCLLECNVVIVGKYKRKIQKWVEGAELKYKELSSQGYRFRDNRHAFLKGYFYGQEKKVQGKE